MKRLIVVIIVALALPMVAIAGKDHKYVGFGTGHVVVDENNNQAKITNDPGEYGGVYATFSPQTNKLSELVFKFKSDKDAAGGAPRWSIPIDTNGDRNTTEGYAFLDVFGCGGSAGSSTAVSTDNDNCHVNFQSVDYPNWKALYTAHPTYKVSKDRPFIIADQAGEYHVYSWRFG